MADTAAAAAAAANGGSPNPASAAASPGGGLYNPEEAGKKLAELDALVPQVATVLHQEKFKQVQAFLKKNNDLIQAVMAQQAKALTEGGSNNNKSPQSQPQPQEESEEGAGAWGVDKAVLQQCAEMIKELNENLTQVYDIYAELAPVPKGE